MGSGFGSVIVVAVMAVALLVVAPRVAAEETEPVRIPGLPASVSETTTTVVVEGGDHFWKISARHLGQKSGARPSNAEIAPYWRRVVVANLGRIRSGDPDLIYPGEVVHLP